MLPNKITAALARAAAPEIEQVLAFGGSRSPKPAGEVSAVRAITLDGFDQIALAWAPLLRPHGFRMELHSVFCHSSPQVTFTRIPTPHGPRPAPRTGRCELADLLVVIDEVDRLGTAIDRRASLIQAKIQKSGRISLSGLKEYEQHELLAWWPTFTFVSTAYDKRARVFATGATLPDNSAKYGGIDLVSVVPFWESSDADQGVALFVGHIDFADSVAKMATGQDGRRAVAGGSDDWSFTIDELLSVTSSIPIVKSTPAILRGNNNPVAMIADTTGYGADGPPSGIIEEWEQGPISFVKLTLKALD